jgi:membrane-associated phospholipid phosphatase
VSVRSVGRNVDATLGVSRVSKRGFVRAGGNLVRIAVLLAGLWSLVLARGDTPIWVLLAWVGGSLAALYVIDRKSGRFGLWAAYVVGFILFALLRTTADELGVPIQTEYAVDADRALFGGAMPQEWLQRHLYDAGVVSLLDRAVVFVIFSYFFVPHIVALVAWRRDRALFSRYCPAVLLTVYFGLVVSFLVPTAPPWLAHRFTDDPPVSRVVADVLGWNPENVRPEGGAGLNPVAAMPSLHLAVTTLIVIALWRHRFLRLLAIGYAAAMAFALVYGGEHWVVDELAGAATACVAWLAVTRLRAPRTVTAPQPAMSRVVPTPSRD